MKIHNNKMKKEMKTQNSTQPVIIFDFDGTIANTLDVLLAAYNEVAEKYKCKKIEYTDKEYIRSHRPQEVFGEYGVTWLKLPRLLPRVRKGIHERMGEVEPHEGMIEALQQLHAEGYTLGVLTSNSVENVQTLLKANGDETVFDFMYSSKKIFGKDKALRNIVKEQHLEDRLVIYIGDETRDIEATQRIDIPIISVTWGFNADSVLRELEPTALAHTAEELVHHIHTIAPLQSE